jgi:archaeoflavoprotein AfpA
MRLKNRFAWGITGGGHEVKETFEAMKAFSQEYPDIDVRVFISKPGKQVLKWYDLFDKLKTEFKKVKVESSSNVPFLAGELQSGKYDFMLIAPTSSNSTAKIALGIGDTMITNAANMALKARIPVYIYPCDIGEKEKETVLPNGKTIKLIVREVDVRNIEALEREKGIHVVHSTEEIKEIFTSYY